MSEQLALFIDFENIAIWAAQESIEFDVTRLIAFLQSRGAVVVKRAYADWSHFSRYREDLLTNSMELTQVYNTNASGKKNRADMWMTVDALETAIARPNIEAMVIVSGDSDFGPLVSKLREYGRYVIGVGPQSGSHHLLIKACDEFVYLDNILGNGQVPDMSPEQQVSRQLLREALEVFAQRGEVPVLATKLKQMILSMDASFNEADLGYRQFRAFLEDHSDLIRLYKKGLQIYAAPVDFIPPEDMSLDSAAPETDIQPENNSAITKFVKPEQVPSEPTPHPESSIDLKAEMFNNNPKMLQIINDLLTVEVDGESARDLESAELFAKKGMSARVDDFSAAAHYYLIASRLMWEVVEQSPQDDSARRTLIWTMASYASCQAAELSQVRKDYEAARSYYLGYFVLVGMLGPEAEHTRGLTNSMLKHYWWNVGRELNIEFDPVASPAGIAIQAARHANPLCREKWQEATVELAGVNPDLLGQNARQMRLNQDEAPEGIVVAQQIEQILGINTLEPSIKTAQALEQSLPTLPVQDDATARNNQRALQDIGDNPYLRILMDDINAFNITEAIPADIETARNLIQTAAGQRSSDLIGATRNSLMACRMMIDAIKKGESDTAFDELRWFMGEYAVAKGIGLSLARHRYTEARPYYLAFFVLIQMSLLTWMKMNALVNPIIKQSWLDIGFELGLTPENVDNPVEAAINALVHSNPEYRIRWAQVTRELVQANPDLMGSFAAQEKKKGLATGRLVAIEIEKIVEGQDE